MTDAFLEELRLRKNIYRPDDFMADRNKRWFLPSLIDDDGEDALLGPSPITLYERHFTRQAEIAIHEAEIASRLYALTRQYEIARHAHQVRQARRHAIQTALENENKKLIDLYMKNQVLWFTLKDGPYQAQAYYGYCEMLSLLQLRTELTLRPLLQELHQL
jgi:hypothetical protein